MSKVKKVKFWAVRSNRFWVEVYHSQKPKFDEYNNIWGGSGYELTVCHRLARQFFGQDFQMHTPVQIAGKTYRTIKGGK